MEFPSFGLAYALKHYCDVTVNKKYQLADWRLRRECQLLAWIGLPCRFPTSLPAYWRVQFASLLLTPMCHHHVCAALSAEMLHYAREVRLFRLPLLSRPEPVVE
jgi:hypothetical protein